MAYEWHRPIEGKWIPFTLLTFAAVRRPHEYGSWQRLETNLRYRRLPGPRRRIGQAHAVEVIGQQLDQEDAAGNDDEPGHDRPDGEPKAPAPVTPVCPHVVSLVKHRWTRPAGGGDHAGDRVQSHPSFRSLLAAILVHPGYTTTLFQKGLSTRQARGISVSSDVFKRPKVPLTPHRPPAIVSSCASRS